jgi:hypothetical protein
MGLIAASHARKAAPVLAGTVHVQLWRGLRWLKAPAKARLERRVDGGFAPLGGPSGGCGGRLGMVGIANTSTRSKGSTDPVTRPPVVPRLILKVQEAPA